MLEMMAGFFIADAATSNPGVTSQPLVAMLVIFLGLCLLAINASISPDGDVKNTISVIRGYLKDYLTR